MRELESIPGHTLSQALGINSRGQVVGLACTAGFASCTAFFWENGVIQDLNDLVPGYDGELLYANDINDAGEITGGAYLPATNETVAFKAVPRHDGVHSVMFTSHAREKRAVILPEHVREKLLQQVMIGKLDR